jgi:hypothetical protein
MKLTRPVQIGALQLISRVGLTRGRSREQRRTIVVAKHITIAGIVASMVVPAASVCRGQDTHVGTRAFAVVLAQNGVPCGVVAPEVVMAWRPGDPRVEATFASKVAFGSGLSSTLESFNARNGLFQATQSGGIVHLRSREEPPDVMAALHREAVVKAEVEIPAATALVSEVALAMRGWEQGGIIGVGAVPAPESLLNRVVRIKKGRSSPITLLDEVVRQVPGLVWLVTYNPGLPNQDLKVGLMDAEGMTLMLTIDP